MTRIACAQIAPTIGALDVNVELSAGAVADAVAQGADVVVLPESATSGYMFADADEARSVALRPTDPVFGAWASAAGDAIVVGGFCELGDDGLLYNSALAVDRDDLEFGEVTRQVALDGVELIAAPVNWPAFPRPEGERPGEVITAMSTARLNRIAVAVCDRAGVERRRGPVRRPRQEADGARPPALRPVLKARL